MDYLAESLGPVQMRIMEGVKEVFDPNMILNPGKIATNYNFNRKRSIKHKQVT